MSSPSNSLSFFSSRRDHAVGQLAGTGEVAAALRLLQFGAVLVQLLLELLGLAELLLFALPALR